jgi:ABC-2 type transport system ATP-binding protein
MNAIETIGLGRRYGKRWALHGLDLVVPEHAVVGLVGPNGAGKSTLLHLVTGLVPATEGDVRVLGGRPGTATTLPDVAFVAQDAPLPRRARVRDLLATAAGMNVRWDAEIVDERIDALGLDRGLRVGELSGGQRAQLALALALAKRPRLLLLDEPVASLDPLARRAFLRSLMGAVAAGGLTVVFSTHLLDDLERACDRLVLLGRGALLLDGAIDDIVARHAVLVGPPDRPLPRCARPLGEASASASHQRLVALDGAVVDPAWELVTPTLDEIVLAYLEGGRAARPARQARPLAVV